MHYCKPWTSDILLFFILVTLTTLVIEVKKRRETGSRIVYYRTSFIHRIYVKSALQSVLYGHSAGLFWLFFAILVPDKIWCLPTKCDISQSVTRKFTLLCCQMFSLLDIWNNKKSQVAHFSFFSQHHWHSSSSFFFTLTFDMIIIFGSYLAGISGWQQDRVNIGLILSGWISIVY